MIGSLWFVVSSAALASTGPHAVGQRDVSFVDPGRGRVEGRVYYPAVAAGTDTDADPTAGPFPLVGMMHGWLGQTFMYDGICQEVASWGFVVASTNTEIGLFLNMEVFARDTDALLHHVDGLSDTPGGWLTGMVADGDWSAMGHSMGGATLAELIDLEPRIRTIVAFMPYVGDDGYYDQLAAFDGAALYLSGSDDGTAPTQMQRDWFAAMETTARGLLWELEGFGHQAVTDLEDEEGSVPKDVQFDVVADLASTFLRAEVFGEEDLYRHLVVDGAAVPGPRRSRSRSPATFATLGTGSVEVGVVGLPEETAEVWFGSGPGATEDLALADAVRVQDLVLADGLAVAEVPVPAQWVGDLAVQVRTTDGVGAVTTRVIELITGSEPPEDTGVPAEDTGGVPTADTGTEDTDEPEPEHTGEPDDSDPPAGDTDEVDEEPESGGCDQTGGAALGGLAALGALLATRRRR